MSLGKVGIAFAGGGFGGAYQVGQVKALAAKGVKPEFVQGISVGALTAAKLIETNWDVDALVAQWDRVEKHGASAIFKKTEGIIGFWKSSIFNNERAFKFLIQDLDFRKIVDSPIEFQIVTVNENQDRRQVFSNHDPRFQADPSLLGQVLLATIAMQGFLPPVMIEGEAHSDGMLFKLQEFVKAKCNTIFLATTDRLPDKKTGTERWFWMKRYHLGMRIANGSRVRHEIEHIIEQGYALIESESSGLFDEVKPLKTIKRRIRKITEGLADAVNADKLENIFLQHRMGLIMPPRLIPSLDIVDFRPGDISKAIEICSVLPDEFWTKMGL